MFPFLLACAHPPPPPACAPTAQATPALLREDATLLAADGAHLLAAGTEIVAMDLSKPDAICAAVHGMSGTLPRGALALLPFQAVQRSDGARVLVTGATGTSSLQVDLAGPYAPVPDTVTRDPASLDLSPPADPQLLGDLPLDAWEGHIDAPVLRSSVRMRGLAFPPGATLTLADGWFIDAVTLREPAEVGGVAFPGGAVLVLAQGCDLYWRDPTGAERCWAVSDGRLSLP